MLLVTLPPDVQDRLKEGLRKAGSRECGGIVMGEHVGENQFVVRDITVQRRGTLASFVRDISEALSGLKRFFTQTEENYLRFNYMGEWHSHPSFAPEPSTTDHQTMLELVTAPGGNATFLVLIIVKLDPSGRLLGTVHTYLPSGGCHRSMLQLENHDE